MKKFSLSYIFRLLFVLITSFSLAVSCSKSDDDDNEKVSFNVNINNLRDETVYFFIEDSDGTTKSILGGHTFTWDLSLASNTGYITVGVKLSDGTVLDKKNVSDGDIYSLVVNKETSDKDVSDKVETWKLITEITNSSSNFVYLYIDGNQKQIIGSGKVLSFTQNIINQNESLVELKNADGVVLTSKKVKKGESYVDTVKDPIFIITKIVLTKWKANNLFDRPDPWMQVTVNGKVAGRTNYQPDVIDGSKCTYSDLYITIDKIFTKVEFSLYDYNLGYSSGSNLISGLYTESFYSHWKQESFKMSVSDLEFTVYGIWK